MSPYCLFVRVFRVACFELRCLAPGVEYSYFLGTLVFALSPVIVLVVLFGCALAVAAYETRGQQNKSAFQAAIKRSKGSAVVLLFLVAPGACCGYRHTKNMRTSTRVDTPVIALAERATELLSCVRLGNNPQDWYYFWSR